MTFDGEGWYDVSISVDVEDVLMAMDSREEEEMRVALGSMFGVKTLEDEMKIKILQELFVSKSLKELEEIINNK